MIKKELREIFLQLLLFCPAFIPSILVLDIDISFWERHFYVVIVQGVIYAVAYVAFGVSLFQHVHPAKQLKVDAAVPKVEEHHLYRLLTVDERMMQ